MPDSIQKQITPRVAQALRYLGTKSELYLTDLPPEIGNADMLRELDIAADGSQGYIEYAWSGNSVWASPYRKKPIRCPTWEQIVARKDERAFRPRIRLSELGKHELANLQDGDGQGGDTTKSPGSRFVAWLRRDVAGKVVAGLIVAGVPALLAFACA